MKKLTILFILCFTTFSYGQIGKYNILFEGSRRQDCCARHECQNWYDIKAHFSDSSFIWVAEHITFAADSQTYIIDHEVQFNANKSISSLSFFSERGNNKRCRKKPSGSRTITINGSCFYDDYDLEDDLMGNGIHNEEAEIFIYPLLTLISPGLNKFLPSEDDITIASHTGFKASEYNWEYSFDLNNWIDMTAYNGSSEITLNAVDILGTNVANYHGQDIHIRQNSCDNPSKVVTYKVIVSAPHISSVNTTPVACFEDENGSIKINFDRALRSGESFSITIEDLDDQTGTVGGIPVYESAQSISNISLESDNSFTFNESIGKALPPGNFRVRLSGFINGFSTYTDGINHKKDFIISEPTPVEFSFTKVDVWCKDGSDGEIAITAKGGQLHESYEYLLSDLGETSGTWVPFTSTATLLESEITETITGLSPKTYELKVRDANGCIAKVIQRDGSRKIVGLGDEIVQEIEITQPEAAVSISFPNDGVKEPSSFGFSDGRITAKINGGTKISDNTYNFIWQYYEIATTTWVNWASFNYDYDTSTKDWFIILLNARAGDYKLTVTDANYSDATDTAGCTISEAEFTLKEPPLLEIALEDTNVISCHNTNTFNDPSSDGELTVTARGGVPFDPLKNGLYAYDYIWKKKDIAGIYQVISGENSAILSNINAGDYAVNIIDANGITVGTPSNNVITPVDELYTLKQPDLLQVTLTKVDVFCKDGNDGSIDATITGGTGDYTIKWNTDATTEDIKTLIAGIYSIEVTDAKGCQAEATITINEPKDPLAITYTFFSPTFSGATNGWIEATVTGGTPLDSGGYTYNWKDDNDATLKSQVTETINATSYVLKLNDLGAGTYKLTIEDKNHPLAINKVNCTIINSEYELLEPMPMSATIQLKTPISCNSSNEYEDPSSDGALEVIATGGVQLEATDNNGLLYYYTWKKETSPGVWTVLTTQTTNIASNLDAGNYAVNIEDSNGIILGVYVDNVLETATDIIYPFEEPPLLELTIEKQDVYCFNGSDSWAKAIITGGTPPYEILWSNSDTTEQTSDLSQGTYSVAITDSRGCQVKGSVKINQPDTELAIDYTAFATPSTADVSDGWIEAQITGGTDFTDGSYTYYWQDDAGMLLNAQTTTTIVSDIYQIRLNNIPKGNYYLTIEDANYPLATTGDGCTIIDEEFILYDPIEATIRLHTPISCHQENVFNNPYSDGKLEVSVTGGVPFETGNPYIYYWKKENASGDFDDLNQNSEIATGLSDGNYALNVEDRRGIVIGVYESLNLINATDVLFDFIEPDLLEVSLTKTAISCGAGNDGTATVTIIGGIEPYDIQWSNGQNTTTATGLIAINYLVYVTDARGCQVSGNISLNQPGGLAIDTTNQTNPTCYQGNDGRISLEISGGVPPYSYAWDTGDTTTSIDHLSKGIYSFELMDANGCTTFTQISLDHPQQITIDLGADRTLCKEQTHDLDGSIADENASYIWISNTGFSATTPQVTVSEAGTYRVTATSSLGCIAFDEIVILGSDTEIDAEFLLSSQAYLHEDVILLNVSNPLGESSEWNIPSNVTILEETETAITLHFPEVDTYEIGLKSTQGACYQEIYKSIIVEQSSELPSAGDAETPFIKQFTVAPNPNSGQFDITIELAEASPIALRIFDHSGNFIYSLPTVNPSDKYSIPMDLNISSSTYLVVLETAQETQIKRLIIF